MQQYTILFLVAIGRFPYMKIMNYQSSINYGSRRGTYRFRPSHLYSFRIKLKFYSGLSCLSVCPRKSFFKYFSSNLRFSYKSSTPMDSSRQDEEDSQSCFFNFIFFSVKSKMKKTCLLVLLQFWFNVEQKHTKGFAPSR